MASNVIDRDLGMRKILAEINRAKTVEVVIGILEGSKNKEGKSIAFYGAANEYGTNRIPSRPFMRESFDENISKINSDMEQQAGLVMQGKSTVYKALGIVGLKHVDRVKKKIGSNIQPENADSTIARKKSSRTLIDNSDMINSVNALVRGKS